MTTKMAIRNIITSQLCHRIAKSSISIFIPPFSTRNSPSFSSSAASHHRNLISLCNLFLRYGFPPSKFPSFLKQNEFLLDSSPLEIEKSFKILLSLKPSQEFLVSTVSGCPRVLQLEFLEKWQLGVVNWEIPNITSIAIRNVLEISRKFGLSPDDVFKCVKCLKGSGFSEDTITRVLENVPLVIMSSEDKICSKIDFLIGIGIQRREIDRVICLFPGFLAFGVEDRLKPLLDEFNDLGIRLSEVKREVLRNPVALGLENGELSQCLEMARNLKCRVAIKKDIFRDGEFRAGYNVKLRIDSLRRHGLIYRDAFTVLWKEPRVILYKIEDIDKKIDFLVHKMKFDVQCLVEVPEYLGVNFDKQIVPRFNVIEHLRSSDGLGDEVSLQDLVKLSRLRFYNMYVKPYPECEKMYGRFAGDDVVGRNCHTAGMWKLFRPQQYTESGEDVKNVKSYMKTLP
ncbi:Mitochondrial transcription termination factor, mTERF [Handroanthus impetiginosus]|uniref:Mitochondrial transcription termination factor, mTERF n=1 Tax=Handroanthus impetiginosus TaxID=429701 RepID=A0A2G9GQS9_9LAMI|nr:Mitochondrial transcription termination factor, mTERF [Handroanthus impetiginosus]PIN07626.1 Mitochondrial transcription termination factor, mTERF [Handroanthus impetiginosus]